MPTHTKRSRGALARPLAAIFGAIATAAVLSGCFLTGGETKATGKAIETFLPKASRGLHWVGDVAPAGSTLSDVARGLGTAIDTHTSIKAQFEKIAASDDPFGEALVTATCYGLKNIASQNATATQQDPNAKLLPPSVQEWEDFLNSQVAVILPSQLSTTIHTRV